MYLVGIRNNIHTPGFLAYSILHQRGEVIVLEGYLDLSFVFTGSFFERLRINVVLGHSLELLGGKPNSSLFLIEVLLSLDAELTKALLNLLEAVSLLSLWKKQAIADILLAFFLQDMKRLFVQILGVSRSVGRFYQLENILSHLRLNIKIVQELFRFGGSFSERLVCRYMLIEGQDVLGARGIVAVDEDGLQSIVESGRLGGDAGNDLIQNTLALLSTLLGIGQNGFGRGRKRRRPLRRGSKLLGSHAAGGQEATI